MNDTRKSRQQLPDELRQRVADLESTEAHYRRIVETAQEGIWLIDAAGQTTFANQRMADLLGYGVEEMQGRSLFDFMDEAARREAEVLMTRRRQGIKEQHDFRFRRKDGTDLWAMLSTNPLMDEQGLFMGALSMVIDVTERKQAEAALHASEETTRALLNATPDAAVLMTPDGIILASNEAMAIRIGQPVAEMLGKDLFSLLPLETVEPRRTKLEEAVRTGTAARHTPAIAGCALGGASVYGKVPDNQ